MKKKKRSRERDHISFPGPNTLLKRTPGGSPSPDPVNGLEGPRPDSRSWLDSAYARPSKQDCETFLCQKRAGNKHTQVSSGVFFVVLVCFPDARALLSSSGIAPACFTETAGPSPGKPGLLWEVQGSGEGVRQDNLAASWGDSLGLMRGGREPGVHTASGPPCWSSGPRVPYPGEVSFSTVRAC